MQISNIASSPTSERTISTSNAATEQQSLSGDNADPGQTTNQADATTQDAAVTISPEGAAMASQESDGGQGSTTNVSSVKSLTYGVLGLERPDLPQENHNEFYTAGRWLAAGLAIGGLISILV
ncbi:hypothetical protein M0D69_21260 [Caballeronia sp. SEWSISQ10-4 2]|uniref:hypothetical protein n=1 Tax=Caballeronia sp. SEWSISQ10-4 2 TaxID=2937438 RepID=UPI0026540414|nr:hypothetical protein [Caballeronia sp. SEWSISQ10-4 2]MDN7180482.1 hypothetical protein [Caballeronia sp. SEWSISQ10-4 2]